MVDEIFESVLRSAGDKAGVFEYDGDTGYFYLYDTEATKGQKVVGAINLLTAPADFGEEDILIRWDANEMMVGLFIREQLWAVFDTGTGTKYGGNYVADGQSKVPNEVVKRFLLQ